MPPQTIEPLAQSTHKHRHHHSVFSLFGGSLAKSTYAAAILMASSQFGIAMKCEIADEWCEHWMNTFDDYGPGYRVPMDRSSDCLWDIAQSCAWYCVINRKTSKQVLFTAWLSTIGVHAYMAQNLAFDEDFILPILLFQI